MSDTDRKKGGPAGEDEIATKQLTVGYKRFYVDVKQNARGRFIKIAEMGSNHKSRITLSMAAAQTIAEKLVSYLEFLEETPVSETKLEEPVELKSDVLNFDTRRYYLDLRENSRGRFLRMAQTSAMPRAQRSQVAIPTEGLSEMREIITDFIARFGEGYMDAPQDMVEAKQLRGEFNKTFYFDTCTNDRGSFVRVSEVKSLSGYRSTITIPSTNLMAFRNALTEVIEKLAITDTKTDVEA